MKISIIIPCKNRLNHLLECLPTVLSQTYRNIEVIIVDFNCPQNTGSFILSRFKDDRIIIHKEFVPYDYWNLSEARNAGFKVATGEFLLFLDADTLLHPNFLDGTIYKFGIYDFATGLTNPPWNGCGCCFIDRDDFVKVRGYNEALKGWGYDDFDFYNRLVKSGLNHCFFDPNLIRNIPHPNEVRNQYHGDLDIHENCKRNAEISLTEFKSSI